jgi:hypothetical protein
MIRLTLPAVGVFQDLPPQQAQGDEERKKTYTRRAHPTLFFENWHGWSNDFQAQVYRR